MTVGMLAVKKHHHLEGIFTKLHAAKSQHCCFQKKLGGVTVLAVLITRTLLFWVYTWGPDVWKLPYTISYAVYIYHILYIICYVFYTILGPLIFGNPQHKKAEVTRAQHGRARYDSPLRVDSVHVERHLDQILSKAR